MADSRRSVGDETRQRISDLSDGWDASSTENHEALEEPAVDPTPSAKLPAPSAKLPPPSAKLPEPRRTARESKPPPLPPPKAKGSPGRRVVAEKPTPLLIEKLPSRPETALGKGKETRPYETGMVATADPDESQTLRRKRGLFGDVLYVKAVVFGLSGDRRGLVQVAKRLATLTERRRQKVLELGRRSLADVDCVEVEGDRDHFIELENRRSVSAGIAAATEEEITASRRSRESEAKALEAKASELTARRKAVKIELETVDKQLAAERRKSADLTSEISALDSRIAAEKDKRSEGTGTEIEVNLAALRADRDALVSDQPEVQVALAKLEPKRSELSQRLTKTEAALAETHDKERSGAERHNELVVALEARLVVEQRAVSDIDDARENLFYEVGESLGSKPGVGALDLHIALEELDKEMGELATKERALERRLSVVDRAKVARGTLLIFLALGATAFGIWAALRFL